MCIKIVSTIYRILILSAIWLVITVSCNAIRVGEAFSVLNSVRIVTDEQPLFCTDSNDHRVHESKILFIVDYTRSNKKSDPNRSIRVDGIRNIISKSQNGDFVKYGFITFSNTIFSPLTSYDMVEFTSDPLKIDRTLTTLSQTEDKGRKKYKDVLDVIQKTVEQDQHQTHSLFTDYYLFFISDGYNVSQKEEQQFNQQLQLWMHSTENVQFHSIYYGNYQNRRPSFLQTVKKGGVALVKTWFFIESNLIPFGLHSSRLLPDDPSEETDDVSFLKRISQSGRGQYTDYNKDPYVSLRLSSSHFPVQQFLVYNLNAGFCLDGYVGTDSDADGLCDKDEIEAQGFYPDNRFSFNDGYGDYFHWLNLHRNTGSLTPCSDRSDPDYDLLTNCEEQYLNSIYSQQEPLQALDIHNPDSDGDGLIDGIEALVYLADMSEAPLDPHNLQQIQIKGEKNDLEKIVRHLSPFQKEESQQAPYDTVLSSFPQEEGSCYGLEQSVLPTYPTQPVQKNDTLSNLQHEKGENVVFIYSLQTKTDIHRGVYRFAYQNLMNQEISDRSLVFSLDRSQLHTLTFQK